MVNKVYATFLCLVLALSMQAQSIFEIVKDSPVHTTLEAAIMAADLDATLEDEGTFTLFAPTDEAFDALPEGTVEALLQDPDGALTDILLYHALGSEAVSSGLMNNMTVSTINGADIIIRIEDDNVFINNAMVTMADIDADNGVVHVIDAVLLPGDSVFDIVVNSEQHTTLETAIFAANLDETLQGDGSFTLFAPTDAAFSVLPAGVLADLLENPSGALTDILLYHALDLPVLSTDLQNNTSTETINGQDIIIRTEGGVFINNAEVTVADIETTNGVVHVIDAVLVPANSVFDIVVNSDDHTTLETAIFAANLDETLEGEGTFTLFAPTDEAFANLPDGALESLLADPEGALANTLLLHALGTEALAGDLSDGMTVEALSTDNLNVTITAEGDVFINNAQVIVTDLIADNGVVHVVNAVISATTNVIDLESDSTVEVYPNPAQGRVTIDAVELRGTIDARIVDLQGKEVKLFEFAGASVHSVNVNDVPAGTYFLVLRDNENTYRQQLVIK